MNKVKTMQEAYRVFELLGIKDVTKKWQKEKKGTEVWELPFKKLCTTMVVDKSIDFLFTRVDMLEKWLFMVKITLV